MATNISSKYEEIISKSDLIQPGPPAVYQLRPKKENIGSLRRMTLGERNVNKINKTILLVGETGTGKSTLINTLVNYAMGVKWEDDVWFQIIEDKKDEADDVCFKIVEDEKFEKRSQTESQTSDVMVYQIFGFEGETLPYSLTIIDTPGYGSTKETEHDDIISQRLFDWFRSGEVHEMNAVGLVLKASVNRLDERLRYIFDSVVSLFGKNMEKNIVALLTHSDGLTPENVLKALDAANIKIAKDEENEPVHFMFNNRQDTGRTKKNKAALKGAWDLTMEGIFQFKEFLEKTAPQNLMATIEVLKARIRLTACIQNLKERVEFTELKQREIQQTQEALKKHEEEKKRNEEFLELKQREIQQTQEALKKHEEEMKRNEEFIVEFDEVYKVKQKIYERRWWWLWLNYGGAVCCTVCEENCHYPGCTLAWYPEHCEVMKDGRCTSCTRKCPVSDHVKEKWIYVTKTRKVQKTLRDMKEKYERGKTGCEENCHYPGCTLAQNPESSDVMKDGRCTSCTGKCPVSDHVKEKIYVNETSKVQKTLQDVKEKYERGKAGCEEKTSLLETLEKQMEKLQKEKDQMLEESFELVVRLDQIALNVDSLSTHVHLDFLIEKMKEKGDTEKVQKLEEMKSRVNKDKGTRAALWYMSGKLTAAVKAAVK